MSNKNTTKIIWTIAMGVCAYNLKKIGKKILDNKLKEPVFKKAA